MSEQIKDDKPLSGVERAALVLLELGEDVAAAVLRHMDEATISNISVAMVAMRKVPQTTREDVMGNFAVDLGVGPDGSGYEFVNRVLVTALGEARARDIVNRFSRKGFAAGLHFSLKADPRMLAHQVANERPQTLALLLAQLPHDTGAAMLSFLPEELVTETLYRFTTLDTVLPSAVSELRAMMGELLANSEDGGRRLANLGGAKQTADILNHLEAGVSERVMDAIDARDKETAEKIRENLFTFIDLGKLSDRSLQVLLREVATDRLAPALRLIDDALRQRFFRNLSARTVEILKEELKSGPPMRKSDVLAAQSEIVETALRLSGEGRIAINASEELV